MATMPADPNADPCGMAAYLREAYYNLLTGQGEKVIRHKGPNGEEEVQFTQANLTALQNELQKWETLCANSTDPSNPKPQRFAIRGGAARWWKPGGYC